MQNSTKILILFTFAMLLGARSTLWADIAILDGDRRMAGIVLFEDSERVEFLTFGGKITLARSDLAGLERESEAMNLLHRAGFSLRRGLALEAEKNAAEALGMGLSESVVRAWCVENSEFLLKVLKAPSGLAVEIWEKLIRDLGDAPAAPKGPDLAASDTPGTLTLERSEKLIGPDARMYLNLDAVSLTSSEQRDFLLAMADLFNQAGKNRVSSDLLDRLDVMTFRLAAPKHGFLQGVLIDQVSRSLEIYDFETASMCIFRMSIARLPATDACRTLMILRWTGLARDLGEFDRAMEALWNELRPLNAAIAQWYLAGTLVDARRRLPKEGRYPEVIALYKKWGERVAQVDPVEVMAEIHRLWGEDLLEKGDPGKAREVFREHYRLKPSEKMPYLALCDFHERFQALEADDFADAFRLGQWAAQRDENELLPLAILAFERSGHYEPLREASHDQIEDLQEEISTNHYKSCLKWFEQGEPARAMKELGQFPFYPAARRLQPDIKKLRKLCSAELTRRSTVHVLEAETLYQDAERRFILGERDSALRDIRKVLKEYSDTPTAIRAERFLSFATARVVLERLVGGAPVPGDTGLPARTTVEVEKEIQTLLKHLGKGSIQPLDE